MALYAAWKDEQSYSIVDARDEKEVRKMATLRGTDIVRVEPLRLKSSKVIGIKGDRL